MDTTKKTKTKERALKHIKVYDQLYAMIKEGTFPVGSQLPSEPDLAVQMHVSRMTLRKALSLLQEDHLIQNIQGKGNFVRDNTSPSPNYQPEVIQHPIKSCCSITPDHTELEFRIEPPSDYMKGVIKRNTAAIVISDRWYKKQEDAIGYTLSFIPIETIAKYQVDLSHTDALLHFLEKKIYSFSSHSTSSYSYTNTGNFTSDKYTISNCSQFILIQETLYDAGNTILLFSKHYIPLQSFHLEVHRGQEREHLL